MVDADPNTIPAEFQLPHVQAALIVRGVLAHQPLVSHLQENGYDLEEINALQELAKDDHLAFFSVGWTCRQQKRLVHSMKENIPAPDQDVVVTTIQSLLDGFADLNC